MGWWKWLRKGLLWLWEWVRPKCMLCKKEAPHPVPPAEKLPRWWNVRSRRLRLCYRHYQHMSDMLKPVDADLSGSYVP